MKDYNTLIADIRTEACELADKLKRLEVFIMSEDFCRISQEQRELLSQQYNHMVRYKALLVSRAYRINKERQEEKSRTCEPEPERADAQKEAEKPQVSKQCSTCWYLVHDSLECNACRSCRNFNHYEEA